MSFVAHELQRKGVVFPFHFFGSSSRVTSTGLESGTIRLIMTVAAVGLAGEQRTRTGEKRKWPTAAVLCQRM